MSIQSYLLSAIDYADQITRQTITSPTDFVAIRSAITTATEQANNLAEYVVTNSDRTTKNTVTGERTTEIITDLLESAISNNAPTEFFKYLSEMRSNGTVLDVGQTQIMARIALAYYFEKISGGVDYGELREFISHANSIKDDINATIKRIENEDLRFYKSSGCQSSTKQTLIDSLQALVDSTDNFILLAGQAVEHIKTYNLHGSNHALVASYHLYGTVDKAYDIVEWSGGVSGAELSRVTYYRD